MNLLSLMIVAACATSCQPPRQGQEEKPIAPEPTAGHPAPNSSVIPTTSNVAGADESQLPPYLFKLEEARKLLPISEPFRLFGASAQGNTDFPAPAPLQEFVSSISQLTELTPLRSFRVSVTNDPAAVASMSGTGTLIIGATYMRQFDPPTVAGTICHELGHAYKNHAAKLADYIMNYDATKPTETSAIEEEIGRYMQSSYNSAAGTYVHRESVYRATLDKWLEFVRDVSNTRLRQEAEADVVGGIICVWYLGFSVDEYIHAYESEQQQFGDAVGSRKPPYQDQSATPMSKTEFEKIIFTQLFPYTAGTSHPTYSERIAQLRRLRSFLSEKRPNSDQLARQWKDLFPRLLQGMSLNLVNELPVLKSGLHRPSCVFEAVK